MNIARAFQLAAPLLLAATATALALAPSSWPRSSARNQDETPKRQNVQCASDVIALLGGLRSGDSLSGWRVTDLDCSQPRSAIVIVDRAGLSLKLTLVPAGITPHRPPAHTERYEIFYGRTGPDERMPADADLRPLLDALANRVRTAEAHAPRPSQW